MNFSDQPGEIYVTCDEHTETEWNKFVKEFEKNHYLISPNHDLVENFVNPLLENILIITEYDTYFRARINDFYPYIEFEDSDLKAPSHELVNYGRLNSKGNPFLYMACDKNTAVSEVRPYLGAKVGIAKCTPFKPLRIVNLIRKKDENRANDFKSLLSKMFSLPVNPKRAELEYRPTQYIAEYFKVQGLDGVKYQSATNPSGENICLFNTESVSIKYKEEVLVKEVNIKFD